jgi:hypothetical protein
MSQYCEVYRDKYLCATFSFENGMKQGDGLLPRLTNFTLDCGIRMSKKTKRDLS